MPSATAHPTVTSDEQGVLRAVASTQPPATIARFRAKHWGSRALIDDLLGRGLLNDNSGRVRLSLAGMYAADLDSLRDSMARFNDALPILRSLYLRDPDHPAAAMEEVLQLTQQARPVDRDVLRNALNLLLPELGLVQTISLDPSSGEISTFTLRDRVLDAPALPPDQLLTFYQPPVFGGSLVPIEPRDSTEVPNETFRAFLQAVQFEDSRLGLGRWIELPAEVDPDHWTTPGSR